MCESICKKNKTYCGSTMCINYIYVKIALINAFAFSSCIYMWKLVK